GAVAPLLDAGDSGGDEVPEEVVRAQRTPERQPDGDRPGCRRHLLGACTEFAWGDGEDFADGVVEGAYAAEPGGERDVTQWGGRGLDQQPGGLRPLSPGDGQRPSTQLGDQLPLNLPHAVPEALREPGHAVAVDHTIGDETHGARDQVGPFVPLWRARGDVGPTP